MKKTVFALLLALVMDRFRGRCGRTQGRGQSPGLQTEGFDGQRIFARLC